MSQPRLSHQACWELLPWHANGTLAPDEAARVDDHLAVCAICREEVRACRELALGLAASPETTAEGSNPAEPEDPSEADSESDPEVEAGLERVMARIAAAESAARPTRRPRTGRWRSLVAATPRPMRRLVAAQAAALVFLLSGAVLLAGAALRDGTGGAAGEPRAGLFRTLADPAPPSAAAGEGRVRVVFAETAAAGDVRDLLIAAGARVVDGPTPFGVYTVEPVTATGELDAARLLARLRTDPAVAFAEPALAAAKPGAPPRPEGAR